MKIAALFLPLLLAIAASVLVDVRAQPVDLQEAEGQLAPWAQEAAAVQDRVLRSAEEDKAEERVKRSPMPQRQTPRPPPINPRPAPRPRPNPPPPPPNSPTRRG